MSEERAVCECAHCGKDFTDPKNAGFPHGGEWFCSHLHAFIHTGDEQIEVANDQLTRYVP